MSIKDKWICKCGFKHSISNKNIRDKKFRKCPYCNSFPSKKDIDKATNDKIIRNI